MGILKAWTNQEKVRPACLRHIPGYGRYRTPVISMPAWVRKVSFSNWFKLLVQSKTTIVVGRFLSQGGFNVECESLVVHEKSVYTLENMKINIRTFQVDR